MQAQSSVDKAVNKMAQRTWVDLTDEDIIDIAINNPPMVHEFARAVLAKSKEKNNG
jgi:acyl CoA:acetate/3-ketoacid CoA transferase beta subunit